MPDPAIFKPCMTKCANYIDFDMIENEDTGDTSFVAYCRAYPQGIPFDIKTWERKHTKVFDDQKGAFVFVDKTKLAKPIG